MKITKLKLGKQGQVLQQFGMIGIGVAILVILLVVVFLINAQVKDQVIEDISATSHAGESKALPNGTAVTFSECVREEDMTVNQLYNGTAANSIVLVAGNYTVSLNTVTAQVLTDGPGSTKYINFTCKETSLAYNSTETMNNNTYSIVGWVALMIVILVGVVILGLVKQIKQ